jgi:hypothetical protein
MDNIYVPSEISSFANMLQQSYMGRHAQQSQTHNLKHTQLWNSDIVWSDMNQFVIYLINVMKDQNTVDMVKSLHGFKTSAAELTLLKQKISHSCQQYAYFVALAIAQSIGLYPVIPNIEWKAGANHSDKVIVHSYNVFAYLLKLLQWENQSEKVGDDDGEKDDEESDGGQEESLITPLQIFIDDVLSCYLIPMYNLAMNSIDEQDISATEKDACIIPFTYKDFCDKKCDQGVIDCFQKLVNTFAAFNSTFYAKIVSQDITW